MKTEESEAIHHAAPLTFGSPLKPDNCGKGVSKPDGLLTKREGLAPLRNGPPATVTVQEVIQTDGLHEVEQVSFQRLLARCCLTLVHGRCSLCDSLWIDHLQVTMFVRTGMPKRLSILGMTFAL